MSGVFNDILKEPAQLSASLTYTLTSGAASMERAATLLREARSVIITGIGASWHAGMAMQAIFHEHGLAAVLIDASELLYFAEIPEGATVVVLSRSGRSLEIIRLLEKIESKHAAIVAITNTPDSPLALNADVALYTSTDFDHSVSISTYSALAMTAGLLALCVQKQSIGRAASELSAAIHAVGESMQEWRSLISSSGWLDGHAATYFLARGTSLASAHEARLLWEETAKTPATALTTGGFRHGPQEIVREGLRVGLWIHRERLRTQDLTLATDLRKLGAKVLLIGQNLDTSISESVISLPTVPSCLQFAIDIVPAQIGAEALAGVRGENCDVFRLCSYIVEDEGGLGEPRESSDTVAGFNP